MLKLKCQYFGHLIWSTDSLERPWFWERLKAGEGDDRGRDGWMTSLIQWTWVWVNSRSWWWIGRIGVLQSMGLQKLDTTEGLNWTDFIALSVAMSGPLGNGYDTLLLAYFIILLPCSTKASSMHHMRWWFHLCLRLGIYMPVFISTIFFYC